VRLHTAIPKYFVLQLVLGKPRTRPWVRFWTLGLVRGSLEKSKSQRSRRVRGSDQKSEPVPRFKISWVAKICRTIWLVSTACKVFIFMCQMIRLVRSSCFSLTIWSYQALPSHVNLALTNDHPRQAILLTATFLRRLLHPCFIWP
jgi:hypothetical protein